MPKMPPAVASALALAAGVAFANECPVNAAGEARRPQALIEGGVRVPRSALFTFPTADIREAEQTSGDVKRTQLTLHAGGQAPWLLASVTARTGRVSIVWQSPAQRADADRIRLSGIEALYAFLLRQIPLAEFEITAGQAAEPRPALTHGAALAMVASWRACAVSELVASGHRARPVAWEQVSIQLQRPVPESPRRVGAVIRSANGRPVAGAPATFMRGDHLACEARTGVDGAASCELFDAHGHEDHDEDGPAPTIITFGGVVTAERILLPVTAVSGTNAR
jgi:hypothetical protein